MGFVILFLGLEDQWGMRVGWGIGRVMEDLAIAEQNNRVSRRNLTLCQL